MDCDYRLVSEEHFQISVNTETSALGGDSAVCLCLGDDHILEQPPSSFNPPRATHSRCLASSNSSPTTCVSFRALKLSSSENSHLCRGFGARMLTGEGPAKSPRGQQVQMVPQPTTACTRPQLMQRGQAGAQDSATASIGPDISCKDNKFKASVTGDTYNRHPIMMTKQNLHSPHRCH